MLLEEQKTLVAALLTYRTSTEGSACYRPLPEVKAELERVNELLKRFGDTENPDTDAETESLTLFTIPNVLKDAFERTLRTLRYSAQRSYLRHEVAEKAAAFAAACRHHGLSCDDARKCLLELELASEVTLPPYSELLKCYETST